MGNSLAFICGQIQGRVQDHTSLTPCMQPPKELSSPIVRWSVQRPVGRKKHTHPRGSSGTAAAPTLRNTDGREGHKRRAAPPNKSSRGRAGLPRQRRADVGDVQHEGQLAHAERLGLLPRRREDLEEVEPRLGPRDPEPGPGGGGSPHWELLRGVRSLHRGSGHPAGRNTNVGDGAE